jgi:uncharacterized protein (PEP-CTERM system associated)
VAKALRPPATGGLVDPSCRPPARARHARRAPWACAWAFASWCGAAWPQAATPDAAPAAPAVVNRPPSLSVGATMAATNNGGLDENGRQQFDFITAIRPELEIVHAAPGLSVNVHAAANLVDYANGGQSNGVLPDARGTVDSTLLDRWLYFNVAAYVRSAESDPFGVRTDDLIAANRQVESGFLAAPFLQHDFGPNSSVLARQQFATTRNDAGSGARLSSNLTLLRFERRPTPLGLSADVSRLDNHASNQGDSHYSLTTARLRGALLVGGEVEIGALVGKDRSDYLDSRHTDPLYGGALDWNPGPRTHFEFELEHRYFGQSGTLRFDHRTPFLALALVLRRQPVDAGASFGAPGQGADLRSALNAILTTRYPDPGVRAGVVDGLVSGSGLNPETTGAVNIIGDYPQLQTAAQADLTLLGTRNTLKLTVYGMTTRMLMRDGEPVAAPSTTDADTRQRGATLQFERRIGPHLSAALQGTWSRIEGLGADAADRSSEQTWRASVLRHLSPRSDVSVGIQWYRFTTTTPGLQSFDATLAIVGLSHRF